MRPVRPGRIHICMLVTNDMTHDSRVARHAATLGLAGYETTVVCKLTEQTTRDEKREGYSIVRAQSRVAQYANQLDKSISRLEAHHVGDEGLRFLARRKRPRWVLRLVLRAIKIILMQLALLREARNKKADLYCANDLDTLLLAVLAAGSDRKVLYDAHELWPDMLVGVPQFLKRMLQSYEALLISRADSVMTVNEFIARELEKRYHVKSSVKFVYNLPSSKTLTMSRRRRREDREKKIALYHGWYSPERGLENLARASEFLEPDIILLFRGAGILEAELKRLSGDRANVRFEPPVSQAAVVDAARGADVGIVPYLPTNLCNYYASPNKLFEYLEAGLPIAASNLPFMRKLVMENEIGTLFDARDPESIAAALNEITRSGQLTRFRRNLAAAKRKYDWKSESQKLLEIYASVL